MHRLRRTLVVAAVSLFAGACAGRVEVALQPAPVTPVAQVLPTSEPIPDILPVQFRIEELLAAPAFAAALEPVCDIREQVAIAEQETASVSLRVGATDIRYTEVRGGRAKAFKDPEKEIALVLLNLDTCTSRTVTITKHGDKLIAPAGWDIEAVRRANGIRWNNWATEYRVHMPENWFVIGNRYPYVNDEKKKRTVTAVFYTPFGRELYRPELVAAGVQYQQQLSRRVDDALRAAQIYSRTDPTQLVVDVPELKPEYVQRKLPIEHMDQGEFILDPEWTTDRIHVVIGVNGDRTATYTCSPAAACGPHQFIKGTWHLMANVFPAAGIPYDFLTGARDPFFSAMAARLLDDYNLAEFKRVLTPTQFQALVSDPHLVEETLDSAYNTGAGRTIAVLETYLANPARYADWTQARGRSSTAHLLAETKGYIAKLRYLRDEWPSRTLASTNKIPDR